MRRRRVFRVAAIYIVVAWVAVQVAATALPGLEIPDVAIRYVWFAVLLGFPLAVAFAWRYDLTPRGIVRTPAADHGQVADLSLRPVDFAILGLLALVAVAIAYQVVVEISHSGATTIVSTPLNVRPNAIAVLPLDNLSGDPEQAYFVDGMQEALISDLSMISSLAVTSRTSTQQFGDSTMPTRMIAAQLGVAKVIEGSVYRIGDRVRISLQLIDAALDRNVWSQEFERDYADVFHLQSEIANTIAREVEARVTQDEAARLSESRAVDPRAYDAYLRARFHLDRFTPQDFELAAHLLQTAVDIEPDYALAYVGLASISAQPIVMGLVSPIVEGPRWRASVERAVALDPNLAEAQYAYAGYMAWHGWNWDEAESAFRRSIQLNPSYARSRIFYSHFLAAMGRHTEATEQMQVALRLDPLNTFFHAMHGNQLALSREYDAALDVYRQTFEHDPTYSFGRMPYSWVLQIKGMPDRAIEQMLVHLQQFSDTEAVDVVTRAYDDGGFITAQRAYAELLESRADDAFVAPIDVAVPYAYAGEYDDAFRWLERAYEVRETGMVYLNGLPFPDEFRDDPRFTEFLQRMKIPH